MLHLYLLLGNVISFEIEKNCICNSILVNLSMEKKIIAALMCFSYIKYFNNTRLEITFSFLYYILVNTTIHRVNPSLNDSLKSIMKRSNGQNDHNLLHIV